MMREKKKPKKKTNEDSINIDRLWTHCGGGVVETRAGRSN